MRKSGYWLSVILMLFLFSCKPGSTVKNDLDKNGGTYFSIKQFIADQWSLYHGQPFGLQKTVYVNGKTDTTLVSAYDVDWAAIFKVFFESDISDKKFLGKYSFSSFPDNATQTNNFFYEAKDDNLYTRKLQISADNISNRVRSVYIETQKKGRWSGRTQKLFYQPIKVISIQEYEKAGPGTVKELRIEYRFL